MIHLQLVEYLLFDVHSTFKMDVIFMESPFTFDNGRISYIWETEEGDEPHSVYSELAFFVRNEDGLYKRFDEVHYQRTFSVHDYVDMLVKLVFQLNGFLQIGKMSHHTMKVKEYSFKFVNNSFKMGLFIYSRIDSIWMPLIERVNVLFLSFVSNNWRKFLFPIAAIAVIVRFFALSPWASRQ